MKTRNIIAILAALPIVAGFTGCKSDDELTAKPAKEILLVEEGRSIEMRSGDESRSVTITANCGWQMSVIKNLDIPWNSLTVQPQRGSGNGTLVITSDQNTSVYDRLDTIMLTTDGGLRQKIALRQKSGDPSINISARTLNFSAFPAESQLLTVNSNDNWTIKIADGVNWIHLDKTSGSTGSTSINVKADPTQTDAVRATTLTFTYGLSSADVQVVQQGMSSSDIFLRAATEQMGFEARGGEQMLFIESNAQWNAYVPSSVTWLRVGSHQGNADETGYMGAGNGELMIECEPNNSTVARLTAIVLIAGTKNPQQFVVLVEQAGVGTPESTVTVGDLTSLYVADKSAEFHYSFTSDQEVIDYGLVYSRENREPTRWNAEVKTVGRGGFTKSVIGTLEGLEPNTTYYVRAYVLGRTGQDSFYYSPNVVTIRTSDNSREPGESDNPNPSLAPRQ